MFRRRSSTSTAFIPRRPRLVTVVKGDEHTSFGFNVHGLKGKPGQAIKTVDEDSPAYQSGLFAGDWILAVNSECMLGATHSMVVTKIKAQTERVVLLVCDEESKEYYQARGIPITTDFALPMGNEKGPIPRAEQEDTTRKNLYGGGDPTAPKVHSYGKTKKGGRESKRDRVKATGSWADKLAAFGEL